MSDMKDSAIKLFGKTIPLPVVTVTSEDFCLIKTASLGDKASAKEQEEQEQKRDSSEKDTNTKQADGNSSQTTEDAKAPTTSSGSSENPKTNSIDKEDSSPKPSQSREQSSETSTSNDKQPLKKPDKVLPCPRCSSMDTKFCYYNNYNVNQPRHFCKNCQRYWTAGGTMRNVPVGAGRRKNKSSLASHYRQIMVSEALRTAQVHGVGGNSAVLTFGSDSPLCESVATMFNLSEKPGNTAQNGYHRPEKRVVVSSVGTKEANADDQSSGYSIANSSNKGGNNCSPEVCTKKIPGFPAHVPCFPGLPWPCSWSSEMPPPTLLPPGFPVSFYPPPAYWGCTVAGSWNRAPHGMKSSGPTSPLGKHLRDGTIINPLSHSSQEISGENGRNILVPKTLRIDDPSEAANSSIWATLGISSNKATPINKGGLFKSFESRSDDWNCNAETSPVLQSNPAALSRSLKFHEAS